MAKRDPWVALARAEKAGRGIRLSAHECWLLAVRDNAIHTAARSCETECTCDLRDPVGVEQNEPCTFHELLQEVADV